MRLRLLCAGLLIFSVAGVAQEKAEKKTGSEDWPVKMFQVKYANVTQLRDVFNAFGAIINANANLKVLTVRAPQSVLTTIEESIKLLDVPPPPARNIELTAHLLIASSQAAASPLPAELDPAIKQLRAIFNYKGYRLLETLLLRAREDQAADLSGNLTSIDAREPVVYTFHINSARIIAEGKDRVFHINNLLLRIRHAGITTDIDVREGQKVVVGKANIDNSDNALILVLTAKVVD